jgi:hypothetical protein
LIYNVRAWLRSRSSGTLDRRKAINGNELYFR